MFLINSFKFLYIKLNEFHKIFKLKINLKKLSKKNKIFYFLIKLIKVILEKLMKIKFLFKKNLKIKMDKYLVFLQSLMDMVVKNVLYT